MDQPIADEGDHHVWWYKEPGTARFTILSITCYGGNPGERYCASVQLDTTGTKRGWKNRCNDSTKWRVDSGAVLVSRRTSWTRADGIAEKRGSKIKWNPNTRLYGTGSDGITLLVKIRAYNKRVGGRDLVARFQLDGVSSPDNHGLPFTQCYEYDDGNKVARQVKVSFVYHDGDIFMNTQDNSIMFKSALGAYYPTNTVGVSCSAQGYRQREKTLAKTMCDYVNRHRVCVDSVLVLHRPIASLLVVRTTPVLSDRNLHYHVVRMRYLTEVEEKVRRWKQREGKSVSVVSEALCHSAGMLTFSLFVFYTRESTLCRCEEEDQKEDTDQLYVDENTALLLK